MTVTVSEFVTTALAQGGRNRLHLKEPGFKHFYARFGPRYLNGKTYKLTLDIATIEVEPEKQGTGVFTRLVGRLRKQFPQVSLYVEEATPLLQQLLLKLGFTRHEFNLNSFYILGDEKPLEEIAVPDSTEAR